VKYVLVDRGDNLVHAVDLASNVGLSGARTYFLGMKQIKSKEFDKLWKVKTEAAHLKGTVERTDHPGYIKWWVEEKEITDEELKI
jgi:hypothetical protein